jgi:hypothetical protein
VRRTRLDKGWSSDCPVSGRCSMEAYCLVARRDVDYAEAQFFAEVSKTIPCFPSELPLRKGSMRR